MSLRSSLHDTASSLRESRWFWAFVGLEVALFLSGWGLDQLGTEKTGLGAHPDVHDAMGAVLGAIGLVFAVAGVIAIVSLTLVRLRREVGESRPTW